MAATKEQAALYGRMDRVKRDVQKRHPEFDPDNGDELTFDFWGAELYVNVWIGGKNVARYADVVDDLEAELTRPAGNRR